MQLSDLSRLDNFSGFGGSLDLLTPLRSGLVGVLNCLPRWLRRAFGVELIHLFIDASAGTEWRAMLQRSAAVPPQLVENQESGNPPDLREVLSQAQQLRARVTLVIPSQEILIRRVLFPTPTPERLRRTLNYELLGYELDRLTPFQAQDLYYDFRFLPGLGQPRLEVELAVVRRTIVDDWLQRLKEANGIVDVVSWPGAWPEANILPIKQRRKPQRAGQVWRWLLTLLVVSLLAAVLVSPILQKRTIVTNLIAQVNKARLEAAKVRVLRTKIEQEEKSANFVVEQKHAANYMVSMLARLTTIVPDDAWANMLNYTDGQVEFSGEAQQATALIELLSRDSAFRNSTFRSPVTSMRGTGKERFNIQFNYVGSEEGN